MLKRNGAGQESVKSVTRKQRVYALRCEGFVKRYRVKYVTVLRDARD